MAESLLTQKLNQQPATRPWTSLEAQTEILASSNGTVVDLTTGVISSPSSPAVNEGQVAFFAITNSTNGTEAGLATRPASSPGMEIFVPTGGSITFGIGLTGVTRVAPPTNQVTLGTTVYGCKLRPNAGVYVTAVSGSVVGRWV